MILGPSDITRLTWYAEHAAMDDPDTARNVHADLWRSLPHILETIAYWQETAEGLLDGDHPITDADVAALHEFAAACTRATYKPEDAT